MTTLALTMTALDGAMIAWFTLTLLSLVLLSFDLATNSPVSWVQKLGWWLVVLYTGPVGFIAFLYACRRPFPGGHDEFTRPVWKQGINSEVHCLAGDATGILVAASVAAAPSARSGKVTKRHARRASRSPRRVTAFRSLTLLSPFMWVSSGSLRGAAEFLFPPGPFTCVS